MDQDSVVMYRPTGQVELDLIRESGWKAFPPRLPEQPFFYPVANEAYATQIARDWNTKDGGTGYVLRFNVQAEFLSRCQVQTAGASVHQEYWIPSEELAEFNKYVVGKMEIIAVHRAAGVRVLPSAIHYIVGCTTILGSS